MTSLTRDEARRRAELVTDVEYDVALDLTSAADFGSVTTVRFRVADAGATTFLDVAPAKLRAATLNGTALDISTCFDGATKRLVLNGLDTQNELVIDATMSYSHDGEGLHRHVDPADGRTYLYAMSFLDAAPRWFACFDQPDLKGPMHVDVRCPDEWFVVGNGPATQLERGRWSIAPTGPLATYFTTLVAGPYHVLHDDHDGIPLSLRVRQSLAEHLDRDAESLFEHTKHSFDELHSLFGVRYPWGEFHQAFVPEFNAGAMENPGCVTYRDKLIFRSRATAAQLLDRRITIAHEMAHLWFGDLVTMRWWDDLWLNESFAEYLGNRVCAPQSWVDFGISRKTWGYAADRRPSTHPVAGNGAVDAATALSEFDGISYAKGASVLRQLAAHLGEDVFLDGLRRYITAHAYGNAEFADLTDAWTAAGGRDLDAWTSAWLCTSGLDELAVRGRDIVRHTPNGTPRTHSIVVAAYESHGAEVARSRVTIADDRTPTGLNAGGIVLADIHDETWAKIVLPDAVWQGMPQLIPGVGEPRTRVALWNALRLAVADAEVDPALAVDIMTTALPAEPDDALIAAVGRWATRTVAGVFLSDARRAGALARLAGAMLAVTDTAEPGSSRQLAAARIAITATADEARLRRWLGGTDLPDGLIVDTDLRWAIMLRLARLGAIGTDTIDDEADADRSSQGAVHAARCRAARPDRRAKRAAWNAIMHDAQRPNYELYALAEGFWDPDQRFLTDTYVDRYFEQIPATAQLRSGWVIEHIATLAYPWTAVDDATYEATQVLVADDALESRIRRAVVDAGDDLRRAIEVRRRYE